MWRRIVKSLLSYIFIIYQNLFYWTFLGQFNINMIANEYLLNLGMQFIQIPVNSIHLLFGGQFAYFLGA